MPAEASDNEANADEEIIRCICGEYEEEEDIERDMICCDKCSAWQHNDCMGLDFPKGQEPEQYFCEKCKPDNHRELLAKIEKGERPWEEVARLRAARIEELKRKKKGKKGGRKSSGGSGGGGSGSVGGNASGRSGSQKSVNANDGSPDRGNSSNANIKREGSVTSTSIKAGTPVSRAGRTSSASPVVVAQLDGQGPAPSSSHRKRKSEHVDTTANTPAAKVQKTETSPPLPASSYPLASNATSTSVTAASPMTIPAYSQQQIPIPAPRVQQQQPIETALQQPQQGFPSQTISTMPQDQGQFYTQTLEQQQLQQQQYQQLQQQQQQQQELQAQQPVPPQEPTQPPPPPTQEEILNSLPPNRRNVANALAKLFSDSIPEAIKSGAFLLPPTLSTAQAGTAVALSVEFAMYKNLNNGVGEVNSTYKQQMRTILFNVKRNPALRDGVLSGSITADRLSTMSTKDMASKEQRQREDEIKREAEKQHIIVKEEGPRLRRTHKGDEIIEDETKPEVYESIFSNAPRRGTVSSLQSGESEKEKTGHVSPPRRKSPSLEPGDNHDSGRSVQGDWRRSGSPGIDNDQRFGSPPVDHDPYRHLKFASSRTEADAEIDALLGDDEDNEEPYSPPYSPKPFMDDADVNTNARGPNAPIWAGTLSMASFTQFHCEAKHVGGADLHERISWSELMPSVMVIDGRIDVKLATNYLCGLRFSQTTDVCVTAISSPTQSRERVEFDKIFEYFAQRNRYGVIGKHANALVKDTYVVPVEKQDGIFSAGDSIAARRPEFLDLLENNSIEDPVTERLLLVVFVVRNGEHTRQNSSATTATPSVNTGSDLQSLPLRGQQPGNSGFPEGDARRVSEQQVSPASEVPSQSQTQTQISPPAPVMQQQSPPTTVTAPKATVPAFISTPTTTTTPAYQPPPPTTATTTASSSTYQQSTAPPPQHYNVVTPAPRTAAPTPAPNPLHTQIFGQYATSPAVTELLSRAPGAGEAQLRSVAEMIVKNPAAANDYMLLAQLIVNGGKLPGRTSGQ